MIVGDKTIFAIEYEIRKKNSRWILGSFRFWISGIPVGDWEDLALLSGCQNKLCKFAESSRNRFEPKLTGLAKEKLFKILFDSFMPIMTDDPAPPLFPDIGVRFHIAYLGMSAFDQFDILLIEPPDGQRIVWRHAKDMIIKEAFLPPNTIQKVAKQFCLIDLECEAAKIVSD